MSVFMDCGSADQALAVTLASLVPGAVEGVVREVVLIDRGMEAGSRKVADHAGCAVIPVEEVPARIAGAKGDWLLFLEPGARLQPGWIGAVVEHAESVEAGRAKMPCARFRRAAADRPKFLARLGRRSALGEGFLVRKAQAIGLSKGGRPLAEMAKGVAVTQMDGEIRPAPSG